MRYAIKVNATLYDSGMSNDDIKDTYVSLDGHYYVSKSERGTWATKEEAQAHVTEVWKEVVEVKNPSEEDVVCAGCGQTFPPDDTCWGHEERCPNYAAQMAGEDNEIDCDCDVNWCFACCPVCNAKDEDC